MKTGDRLRFDAPLYTPTEAAHIIDVPPSTLRYWVNGHIRRSVERPDVHIDPIITTLPAAKKRPERGTKRTIKPTIPFIGLAEAFVLAALRRSGVPMQRIRPAIEALKQDFEVDYVLASHKLYTDGAELLYDYGESLNGRAGSKIPKGFSDLTVVRNKQQVFTRIIEEYLELITYEEGGYAKLIRLPAYKTAEVVADPTRSFGAPIFKRGAASVECVLERVRAGETIQGTAKDFGIPVEELEDVVRVGYPRAA